MQKSTNAPARALEGITVIDLAGPLGNYCGKLYADMGADVILVEPPGGAATRHLGPYIQGDASLEASLRFQYENTNKRSIVLDLDQASDRETFLQLARRAHIVIESDAPGVMQRRGLGYEALREANPAIVLTSITPFGQEGPYADWLATDLTAMAMGGMMYLAGYPDTAPMVACGEQAVAAANLFAAVASLAACYAAEASGQGQHVDVSMQECVVMGLENAVQFYDLEGTIRKRNAGTQRLAGTGAFPCRDGYVYLMAGGIGSNRFWGITTEWLISEGLQGAMQFREPCWSDQAFLATDEAKHRFHEVFAPFALKYTKAELQAKGRQQRIPIAPICDAGDIARDPQREHRGYFVEVTQPGGTVLRMPGAPYRMGATPWRLERGAPRLDQHGAEIRTALSAEEQPARIARGTAAGGKRLLAGLRVIDFSWIGAGSYTTKILADLGAEVIKIESSQRMDTLRVTKPFKDGVAGVNRSGYFADRNSSKRSATINVKDERGLRLVKRLIADAHLVSNNFTPGVMDKLGLGYGVLRELRPGLVFASMSMQGASGPAAKDLGYGLTIAALTGFMHLTGLPDREPAGTGTNYPDHIPNPGHAAFAILAALRHQRRSGQGQLIDLAQMEPTLAMLGPTLMNYFVNGVIEQRAGNTHPERAPHGVYRCAGDDRWIAIAVCTDEQWQALAATLALDDKAEWTSQAGRLADRATIDAAISLATAQRDSLELARALQAAKVPCGPVQDARDVLDHDPQLAARGHWVTLDHPEMGPSTYNSAPYRYSHAESAPSSPAPLLGQHTREVCSDLLGLDDDEINQLEQDGVLS